MKYQVLATFVLNAENRNRELRAQMKAKFKGERLTHTFCPHIGETLPFEIKLPGPDFGIIDVTFDFKVKDVRHNSSTFKKGKVTNLVAMAVGELWISNPEVVCEMNFTEVTVGDQWDATFHRNLGAFREHIIPGMKACGMEFVSAERAVFPKLDKFETHTPDEEFRLPQRIAKEHP